MLAIGCDTGEAGGTDRAELLQQRLVHTIMSGSSCLLHLLLDMQAVVNKHKATSRCTLRGIDQLSRVSSATTPRGLYRLSPASPWWVARINYQNLLLLHPVRSALLCSPRVKAAPHPRVQHLLSVCHRPHS